MSFEVDYSEVRKKPSLLVRLVYSVISLVIFLIVAELALGFYKDELLREGEVFPGRGNRDFYHVFERDSERLWRLKPNSKTVSTEFPGLVYEFNSAGFRGREILQHKPDYRILALGNSCTFGWGIPLQQIWTERLRDKLNVQFPASEHEVINAGVPGYTSFQGNEYLLGELLEYEPDAVIITFGWNDHWAGINGEPDSNQNLPSQALLDAQNLLSRLNIYSLIRKVIIGFDGGPEERAFSQVPGVRRVPIAEFVTIMTNMIDTLNQRGIQPLLVVPPIASLDGYFGGKRYLIHTLHEPYQEAIRLIGSRTGTPLVDLQPLFDHYQTLFPKDPVHYNAEGHEVVADALSEVFSELVDSSGNTK